MVRDIIVVSVLQIKKKTDQYWMAAFSAQSKLKEQSLEKADMP